MKNSHILARKFCEFKGLNPDAVVDYIPKRCEGENPIEIPLWKTYVPLIEENLLLKRLFDMYEPLLKENS